MKIECKNVIITQNQPKQITVMDIICTESEPVVPYLPRFVFKFLPVLFILPVKHTNPE